MSHCNRLTNIDQIFCRDGRSTKETSNWAWKVSSCPERSKISFYKISLYMKFLISHVELKYCNNISTTATPLESCFWQWQFCTSHSHTYLDIHVPRLLIPDSVRMCAGMTKGHATIPNISWHINVGMQVTETTKRSFKPNRSFGLKIDRFDHPSQDSGRMKTLRNCATIQTWTSVCTIVVDTIKSNTRRVGFTYAVACAHSPK